MQTLTFKFSYKNNPKFFLLIFSLLLLLVINNINIGSFKHIISLVVLGISIIQLIKFIKFQNKYLGEIRIINEEVRFSFLNSFKNPLTFSMDKLEINHTAEEIIFIEKISGKLIGIASHNMMIEKLSWTNLLDFFTNWIEN